MKGTKGRRRQRLGWALLPLLFVLVQPASAEAVWSTPVTLSDAGQDATLPRVAVDQSGNAVFVWLRYDGTALRVEARARSAGGVLGPMQILSAPGQHASYPDVAVDQDGDAVFVWRRFDGTTGCGGFPGCVRIQARARSAAGVLSTIQTLSAAGQQVGDRPHVAVDPAGNSVFVWQRYDGTTDCGGTNCLRIESRARSASGALSAVQILSDPGQNASAPQVAIDPGGNAVAVWDRTDGTTGCFGRPYGCRRIQARVRAADGTLSATQTISAKGQEANSAQVGIDQGGNAVFVWERQDGSTDCDGIGCLRAEARARSANGHLSQVQTLSDPGQHAEFPEVASDPTGNAVFVWERHDGSTGCGGFPGCDRIQARARSASGVLSATQTLSAGGEHATYPDVAVDNDGNAVVIWKRFDGTPDCGGLFGCLRVQARTRSATEILGTTQTLSAAGQDVGDLTPGLAVSPNGKAVATWSRFGGTYWRIQAALGP